MRAPTAVRSQASEGSAARLWLAMGIVYVVWGSTYLAIRVAIRTMPPFLMASTRFVVAGAVLFVIASRRRDAAEDDPIGWRQVGSAALIGTLLLAGGNGGVVWAEQHVSTGVVALLIATVPLWILAIGAVAFGKHARRQEVAGLILGFGGLVLLIGMPGGGRPDPAGVGVVVAAALCWATGSVLAGRLPLPRRVLMGTSIEMLAGGVVLAGVGLASGEAGRVDPSAFSLSSVIGLAYLIVFGSLVAFTAYQWLLQNARITLVSTYAYVNPVVAVLLGVAFLSERLTLRMLVAGLVILAAVAMIVTARRIAPAAAPEPCPDVTPRTSGRFDRRLDRTG
jgi:drug/metabolite transporter (DMT)-like permease